MKIRCRISGYDGDSFLIAFITGECGTNGVFIDKDGAVMMVSIARLFITDLHYLPRNDTDDA